MQRVTLRKGLRLGPCDELESLLQYSLQQLPDAWGPMYLYGPRYKAISRF